MSTSTAVRSITPLSVPDASIVMLSELVRDDRLRFREPGPFAATVAGYAELMRDAGGYGDFPPVQAVELTEPFAWTEDITSPPDRSGRWTPKKSRRMYMTGRLVLWSGFARCAAAEAQALTGEAEMVEVPCVITPGTWADAVRLSWAANAAHGRPRSAVETAQILDSILARPEYGAASGSELARLAGCSKATVNRHRAKAKTKAALPPPPAGLTDDRGQAVPERLHATFAGVPAARKLTAGLRAGAETLSGLANLGGPGQNPAFAMVDAGAAIADVLKAVALLEEKLPGLVCGACGGAGCGDCGQRGYHPAGRAAQ